MFFNRRRMQRDFYADISSGTVPAFDVLVTNPPYRCHGHFEGFAHRVA